MTSMELLLRRLLQEADERHPSPTSNDETTRPTVLRGFRADYILRELKREILRDPGLLAELGVHRTDMV